MANNSALKTDYTVTFTGSNGAGTATLGGAIPGITAKLAPKASLSNGATVTVTLTPAATGDTVNGNPTAQFKYKVAGLTVTPAAPAPAAPTPAPPAVVNHTVAKSDFTVAFTGVTGKGTAVVTGSIPGVAAVGTPLNNLSNNDVVTVNVSPTNPLETVNTHATAAFKYTVTGLSPASVNITASASNYSAHYSGKDKAGTAILTGSTQGTTAVLSPTTGLSNGDKLTVTVTPSRPIDKVNGKASDKFTLTVSGLIPVKPPVKPATPGSTVTPAYELQRDEATLWTQVWKNTGNGYNHGVQEPEPAFTFDANHVNDVEDTLIS